MNLLTIYCVLIVVASLAGGLVPLQMRFTHRRMQIALSFISGVMMGVALLHLLPQAWEEFDRAGRPHSIETIALWLLAGFLSMFLLERFLCFHHHEEVRDGPQTIDVNPRAPQQHLHRLTWTGATVGLTLHSLLAGVALAAAVEAGSEDSHAASLAGFSAFLVIFLHKPFDSLTIGTLMAAGSHSRRIRHLVNGLFALAVPAGAVVYLVGLEFAAGQGHLLNGAALAVATGMFLCISLSDVLPELQFHQHDRVKLTLALFLGLLLAWSILLIEPNHLNS